MPRRFTCPSCQATIYVADEHLDRNIRCPKCRSIVRAPVADAPAAEPRPPVGDAVKVERTMPVETPPKFDDIPEVLPSEDDDEPPQRRRRPGMRPVRRSPVVAIVLGVCLVLLVLCGGMVALGYSMWKIIGPALPPVVAKPALLPAKEDPPAPPMGGAPLEPARPPEMSKGNPPLRAPEMSKGNPPAPPAPRAPEAPRIPPPSFLPAVVLPITPTPLPAAKTTLPLPSAVRDFCVGGGGRFLIFHLPQLRQIAVFDANVGRVVKYLTTADDAVLIAAGMDKLIVALPDKGILQRYSLVTFEREQTVNLPAAGRIIALQMGSASAGPLIVGAGQGEEMRIHGPTSLFLDPATFQIVDYTFDQTYGFRTAWFRFSPDGTVLAGSSDREGGISAVFSSGRVRIYYNEKAVNPLPCADNRHVLCVTGVFTTELNPIATDTALALPALQGSFYMKVRKIVNSSGEGPSSVAIHLLGDTRPLLTLSDVDGVGALGSRWDRGPMLPAEKRLFLMPESKLLVILPPSADRLILHRFDLDDALDKAGIDYLFVASRPPPRAARGQEYVYQLQVKSKKGGVRYKLESGPEGMKVSATGRVTWAVPRAIANNDVSTIVSVADATGQEVFHTFTVSIVDKIEVSALAPATGSAPKVEGPRYVALKLPEEDAKSRPSPLKSDVEELRLSGEVGDIRVGGAGRYLLLHVPQFQRITVFDATTAKVVKNLDLEGDNLKFAANRDKLIVSLPDRGLLYRYSLTTFEREVKVVSPIKRILALGMGSASDGPLAVLTADSDSFGRSPSLTFLDPQTFRESPYRLSNENPRLHDRGTASLHLSEDGSVLTGPFVAVREGQTYRMTGAPVNTRSSPDGRLLIGPNQRYSIDGRYISDSASRQDQTIWYVAAASGRYLVSVHEDHRAASRPGLRLHVSSPDDGKTLFILPQTEALTKRAILEPTQLSAFEGSVILLADQGLLVLLPAKKDRLVLHRFDVVAHLDNAGVDYLLVTSRPPGAVRGTDYVYQLSVKSRKGGVKARLDGAPQGMTLTPDGRLTWSVPRDYPVAHADVILSVTDDSGQEVLYTFAVAVRDYQRS